MAWSAEQYLKFEDERTRPARDLLAQVPLQTEGAIYDLGCGPGNSTELLTTRFAGATVIGVDSDDTMLETARRRLPGQQFVKADLAEWTPPAPATLLYANAVFQWVPDHLAVLDRLIDHLVPGGALAVQMPDNLSEPSHALMEETGRDPRWAQKFAGGKIRRAPLPEPGAYFDRLGPKASRLDVWRTHYHHPLKNAAAIVEWVRSTGLRPYLDAAGPEHAEAFAADYLARLQQAYPQMGDGRVLLGFPRLFVVAVKA